MFKKIGEFKNGNAYDFKINNNKYSLWYSQIYFCYRLFYDDNIDDILYLNACTLLQLKKYIQYKIFTDITIKYWIIKIARSIKYDHHIFNDMIKDLYLIGENYIDQHK